MNCSIHCFKNNQNQTIELNQSDNIDEVDFFSFYLESDSEIVDFTILITDIPIKLVKLNEIAGKYWYIFDHESVKDYFASQDFRIDIYTKEFYITSLNQKIYFYKLFINYPIGICEIELFDNISQEKVTNFALNIISAKINETEFASLINYVESKGSSIWAKHSLLKHTASPVTADDKIDWLLTYCESFINEMQEKYLSFFSFDKIKVIKQKNEIVVYSSDVNTSEESLFWLLNNLDTLQSTGSHDTNKITINNRIFSPLEILSNDLEENTDTNENQLIHGFISELRRFLYETKSVFEDNIKNCSKVKFEGLIDFYSYSRSLNRLKNIFEKLLDIKNYLEIHIPVSVETLDHLNTNKIESKEHYNFIYNRLVEWLLYKDASFSKDKKLYKGINRMDQLFEKACFYKLIDSFKKLEYDVERIDYNKNAFPNKIKLTKKGIIHFLYFENLPQRLTTVKKNSGRLKPDFFIELENGKFIIIDAKYKKLDTINKFDYPELTLKYLHGIGAKNGGLFNPIALFILFPGMKDSIDFYQNSDYDLYANNPVFPSIGSIGLNFETESRLLNSSMQKLVEMD